LLEVLAQADKMSTRWIAKPYYAGTSSVVLACPKKSKRGFSSNFRHELTISAKWYWPATGCATSLVISRIATKSSGNWYLPSWSPSVLASKPALREGRSNADCNRNGIPLSGSSDDSIAPVGMISGFPDVFLSRP